MLQGSDRNSTIQNLRAGNNAVPSLPLIILNYTLKIPMKRFKGLRIGSWNVLSLYRSKSLHMLLDQLEKYYGRCQEVGGENLEECCKE